MKINTNPARILLFGLNNSGKTTVSKKLAESINAVHFNGDEVRKATKNTDFTIDGRILQNQIMNFLANKVNEAGYPVVVDFICPLDVMRQTWYDSDTFLVFLNIVKPEDNEFQDTGLLWQTPKFFDVEFTEKADVNSMVDHILKEYNYWLSKRKDNYNI